MRQLSPITNLLLAVAFSLLSVLALGMPWFAVAEAPSGSGEGAMEAIATDIYEFFASPGTTGSNALGDARQPLVILAAVTAGLAVLMLVGFARKFVREILRFAPLAAPILIVMKAVDHPAAGLELRWGILIAFIASAFAASAAFQGAELQEPKPKPKVYTPPPPAGSVSPPGA